MVEKIILDLGCGGNKYEGAIGIDIVGPPATSADLICNLGFEKIPVTNSTIDLVVARHFIEHIPHCVWLPILTDEGEVKVERHQASIFLFNEIYRVLKDRGKLYVEVPTAINALGGITQPAFQDPTHASFWCTETVNYFSGDYFGFHDVYSHTSRFQKNYLELREYNGWLMEFEFEAIKNLPSDSPYLLSYE